MNVIKRHKGLAIIGGLSLILLIIIFIIFSRMIFSSTDDKYGRRLNGLVSIDESETDKLISEISENEKIEKISVDVKGKIIYIIMNVSSNTSRDDAKVIANSTISYYNEDVVNYYDFEFLVKQNTEDDTGYSMAGSKKVDNESISWTRG